MNRYVLKKDTMTGIGLVKAGEILEENGGYYKTKALYGGITFHFDNDVVENNPDWFEKERWRPSNGKLYDYVEINSSGVVLHREAWHDDKWDNKRFDSFNCFDPDSKDNRAGNVAAKMVKVLKGEL